MPKWLRKTVEILASVVVALVALMGWVYARGGDDATVLIRLANAEARIERHELAPDIHVTIPEVRDKARRLAALEAGQKAIQDDVSEIRKDVDLLVRRELEEGN